MDINLNALMAQIRNDAILSFLVGFAKDDAEKKVIIGCLEPFINRGIDVKTASDILMEILNNINAFDNGGDEKNDSK